MESGGRSRVLGQCCVVMPCCNVMSEPSIPSRKRVFVDSRHLHNAKDPGLIPWVLCIVGSTLTSAACCSRRRWSFGSGGWNAGFLLHFVGAALFGWAWFRSWLMTGSRLIVGCGVDGGAWPKGEGCPTFLQHYTHLLWKRHVA